MSVEQLRRNEAGEGPISAKRLYWLGVGLNVSLDEFFRRKVPRAFGVTTLLEPPRTHHHIGRLPTGRGR
jgi:hypothetical protein